MRSRWVGRRTTCAVSCVSCPCCLLPPSSVRPLLCPAAACPAQSRVPACRMDAWPYCILIRASSLSSLLLLPHIYIPSTGITYTHPSTCTASSSPGSPSHPNRGGSSRHVLQHRATLPHLEPRRNDNTQHGRSHSADVGLSATHRPGRQPFIMPADFFLSNFVLFAVVTAACTLGQSYLKTSGSSASKDASSSSASNSSTSAGAAPPPLAQSGSARSLWRAYILVYALVMGGSKRTRASRPIRC